MSDCRWMIETLEDRLLLAYHAPASVTTDTSLDASWKFIRQDVAGASAKAFDDSSWSTVAVPNTWNAQDAQDGGNNYYQGIGWYRKHFTIPTSEAGEQFYLKFDGSMLETNDVKVYSNLDSVTLSIDGQTHRHDVAEQHQGCSSGRTCSFNRGANLIKVTGTKNGQTFTDMVTWNCPGSAAPAAVRAPTAATLFSSEVVENNSEIDSLVS